uniref:Uncharacterized protein n=1 Tax=Eiseniibacteriota bacterium TaxID=2212470 RepID=A0A832I8S5_UNCEI
MPAPWTRTPAAQDRDDTRSRATPADRAPGACRSGCPPHGGRPRPRRPARGGLETPSARTHSAGILPGFDRRPVSHDSGGPPWPSSSCCTSRRASPPSRSTAPTSSTRSATTCASA